MSSSGEALIGAVVQKSSYATTSFHGRSGFTAPSVYKPPSHQVLGRVLERMAGSQHLYHVVYEDGDESFLPEAEIRTWLSEKSTRSMTKLATADNIEPVYKRCASPQRKKTSTLQTTPSARRAGRVVSSAPALPSGEPAYHVVYEDGDEAILPESEIKLFQAAFAGTTASPQLATTTQGVAGLTASRQPCYGTSEGVPAFTASRQPCYGTSEGVPALTSTRQRHVSSAMAPSTRRSAMAPSTRRSAMSPLGRLFQWGRRSESFSQAPMPPRGWPVHYCEVWTPNGPELVPCEEWRWSVVPVQTYSLGWRLAQGLFVLLFALMIFSCISKAADFVGGWRPLDDLCWWVGAPAAPASIGEDVLGGFELGASWAAANIDRVSVY